MVDRDLILKKIVKIEDKLLVSKILDKASKACNISRVVHSDFLDPYQQGVVERALTGCKDINYMFTGGYAGAERMILMFSPNFMPFDDYENSYAPLKTVHLVSKSRDVLSHRDYLGALMSLGIKREKIGDILVREDICDIIVLEDMAEYIASNLDRVANTRVEPELKYIDELEVPELKVKEISTTVASLRLDCIASAGFGVSRSKIVDFIKAEKVNLNWEMTDSLTKQVKEGDTISIKGKGRVLLEKVGNTTKKGRVGVLLKKLI
ncbi:MAG: YlmH/Sll1252 family protein [Clostridia bacterium]|nr:YlmH/Sll1252 family protein [Clostridia bacterium]